MINAMIHVFDPKNIGVNPTKEFKVEEVVEYLREAVGGFLYIQKVPDMGMVIVSNEEAYANGEPINKVIYNMTYKKVYGVAVLMNEQYVPDHMKDMI